MEPSFATKGCIFISKTVITSMVWAVGCKPVRSLEYDGGI
jgi:hypothetical protein